MARTAFHAGVLPIIPPMLQPDAVLSQANPVSGTQYEALPATANVRIRSIAIEVAWTVQPTPVELWVVIDGTTIRHVQNNPVTATSYGATLNYGAAETLQLLTTTVADVARQAFLYEGRSVQVLGEITGGTVQSLDVRVKWDRW